MPTDESTGTQTFRFAAYAFVENEDGAGDIIVRPRGAGRANLVTHCVRTPPTRRGPRPRYPYWKISEGERI